MTYFCNPINIPYSYQFIPKLNDEGFSISREGADPSIILFENKYYMFLSMNLNVFVSSDLISWKSYALSNELPLYNYAPDVRVLGDYVYFSASLESRNCDFFRTKDILNGPWERIEGTFPFWDPNLFQDDDGKVYLYWGCSSELPLYGVELDKETMLPIGEKKELIFGNPQKNGFELNGENHSFKITSECNAGELIEIFRDKSKIIGDTNQISSESEIINSLYSPYIEGAWMTKYHGVYYLQYASPATELNVYNDGVYISNNPLGPFKLAKNNPFSYKPGGFLPGAGHGSTFQDKTGDFWHAATNRISINHKFERRVSIWRAGFDKDNELYCDQRYGDWPQKMDSNNNEAWQEPDWMLLSYNKRVRASSFEKEHEPHLVTNENVQDWWRADNNLPGNWVELDLEKCKKIHGIQINFADQDIVDVLPGQVVTNNDSPRYIDQRDHRTRWLLEGSIDGLNYKIIEDKSKVETDLPHDFLQFDKGINYRYIKLTIYEVPFHQKPCISGIRVFGVSEGKKPNPAYFEIQRIDSTSMKVIWDAPNSTGVNILWGYQKDKLYHSHMKFSSKEVKINSLIDQEEVFIRVDSFNESGITPGEIKKLED